MSTPVVSIQALDAGLGETVIFPSPGKIIRMRMRRHKGFIFGGIAVLLTFLIAILAPIVAPHDPYEQNLETRLVPTIWQEKGTWNHPLGTDNLGRDYLSRLVYGCRISLIIGFSIMMIALVLGTIMGMLAGTIIVSKESQNRKVIWLFFFGFVFFIIGGIWSWFFPLNKNLWSSSFVLHCNWEN